MEMGYYNVSNSKLWDKRTYQAKANGYKWASDFTNREPSFHEAERFCHGSSKLLLCLFFNHISNRKEMRYTTIAIEKSYGKKDFYIL